MEGDEYRHNLLDGFDSDLDQIVRNIIMAKDRIMIARTDTLGRMNMIDTRRAQIISQYKREKAIVDNIQTTVNNADKVEKQYNNLIRTQYNKNTTKTGSSTKDYYLGSWDDATGGDAA